MLISRGICRYSSKVSSRKYQVSSTIFWWSCYLILTTCYQTHRYLSVFYTKFFAISFPVPPIGTFHSFPASKTHRYVMGIHRYTYVCSFSLIQSFSKSIRQSLNSGRFPAGRAVRSYCAGLSHGPVSAPIPNANFRIYHPVNHFDFLIFNFEFPRGGKL